VDGAQEGPFRPHLFDAAQEELSKASGLLDLTEHRLDGLFAQSVAAAMSGAPQPLAHGLDLRPAPLSIAAVGMFLAPGGNIAADATVLQGLQVGL
jgi:hypothetical protein